MRLFLGGLNMAENIKFISTTALSKEINIKGKDLFNLLQQQGWIEREGDTWTLTQIGKEKGGIIKSDSRLGTWIAWPDIIRSDKIFNQGDDDAKLINATVLSQTFNISRFRINPVLSELGWIQKERDGYYQNLVNQSVDNNLSTKKLESLMCAGLPIL
jgi:hypothetical protein